MESTRAYTFQVILLLTVLFAFGFMSGKAIAVYKNKIRGEKQVYSTIEGQRFLAINKAIKEGKKDYEFEVGYVPILNQ